MQSEFGGEEDQNYLPWRTVPVKETEESRITQGFCPVRLEMKMKKLSNCLGVRGKIRLVSDTVKEVISTYFFMYTCKYKLKFEAG